MLLREGFLETRIVGNRELASGYLGLFVPPLRITQSLDEACLGSEIVFVVDEDSMTREYVGLAEHLRVDRESQRIFLLDNHNYALAYWLESAIDGIIPTTSNCLVHVDQHSDLRPNDAILPSVADLDHTSTFEFAHARCQVGNYIVPAIRSWFIGEMTRIESEFVLREHDENFSEYCDGAILNIDLDFFAPEMWNENTDHMIGILRAGMSTARVVTIATSPYFLDQTLALSLVRRLFA